MSVLNQSGEEQVECPLCMEPLEVDDLHFYPCTCGYQICRFCWNRIREGENGLCPACRKAYPENPADFTPLSQEQVAAIKTEKRAREQKRRNKTLESRRALANVRVVQNNLVFVVGLPVRLADPEILKRQEYFGKYGKIHKVVINQSTTYAGSQGPSASAYVTYVTSADALRAIQGVNNVTLDGRVLKGSLGTTKYCANFMKNQPCPKPDCMYLHDLGDSRASFTKEEMHAGLHQVYERKLHNALLASSQRPDDKPPSTTGNTSTNADKGSSKEGTQSNFIPTTVVTSSHINVVNSSRSKKDSVNGGGSSSGSGSSASSASGKEAWPSLGSSPPADTPPKRASPKPQPSVKSQENGTSEPSSPTHHQHHPAPSKPAKDTHTDSGKTRHKETPAKKSKSTDKAKRNGAASATSNNSNTEPEQVPIETTDAPQTSSVFEPQNFLTDELDELESDRHSLLENHDLLDNSEHSLLEDDTHSLLHQVNNEALMMQRQMLNMVDSNLMKPMVNGYGLMERDMYSERHGQSEPPLHARSRGELLMRQSELLARQHAQHAQHAHSLQQGQHAQHALADHKHYAAAQSIGIESASDLLGANYHQNHNMLPFGMRVDNSASGSSQSTNQHSNLNPHSNSIPANSMGSNSMGMGPMNPMAPFMQQQMMQQSQGMPHQGMQHAGLLNGFDGSQSNSEGRYLAENMDKFFTDFHKAQQMRLLLGRGEERPERRAPPERQERHAPLYPRHMLSAERLEMQQHRMNSSPQQPPPGHGPGGAGGAGGRACGDADDDLDFDPFKETQKALAEMMETELMQNTSGDNLERVRRARLPPPGFGHIAAFPPRPAPHHQDWTAMDPAIVSTSAKPAQPLGPQPGLSPQQQQLFARFNQLGVNGTKVSVMGGGGGGGAGAGAGAGWAAGGHKLWGGARVPLPPGFAPQPAAPHHPPECIDAK